jgi:hypothetical protein
MGSENDETTSRETKKIGNMGDVYRATAKDSQEKSRKLTSGKMPGEEEMESSEHAGLMPEG